MDVIFCELLFSLNIVLLRFIQVVICIYCSFIFNTVWYFIVWTCYNLFIHSSADRYLGCVHIFAVMNNMTLNILIPISLDTSEEIWRSIAPTVIGNQLQPQQQGVSQKSTFIDFIPDLLNQNLQGVGTPNCEAF